jgi:hypothetical protein
MTTKKLGELINVESLIKLDCILAIFKFIKIYKIYYKYNKKHP